MAPAPTAGAWRALKSAATSYWQGQRRAVQEAARARRESRGDGGHLQTGALRQRAQGSGVGDPSRAAFGTLVIASAMRVFGVLAAALGLGTAIAEWATARTCFEGSCFLNRSAIVSGFLLLFGGTLYAALLWGLAAALSLLQQIARNTGRGTGGPRP